jgi:hypothetical protein
VRVAVEKLSAEELAKRAAFEAYLDEASSDSEEEKFGAFLDAIDGAKPGGEAGTTASSEYRVAVRDCFAVKEALKEKCYQWDPASKAWWTPLESDTLEQLRTLAQREGFDLLGMAAAEANARRVLAGGVEPTPAPGGSPARAPPRAAPADVTTPSPARPPRRTDDAAAWPVRRSPAAAAGRASPYARPPVPAPRCDVHGVSCVLRTAGSGAMPHNRGRRL